MSEWKSISLDRIENSISIQVGPAISTVLLLVGHLAARHDSDDWREWWKHPGDPMWRIGKNWPTDEPSARSFIANDLELAFGAGYNIVVDAVALGRGSWTILSDEARKNVAKINDGGSSLTVRYNVPGERKPVECIYEKLPVDYSLPFIGAGILRFRRWPARLLAFEFAVITGWSAGPDR